MPYIYVIHVIILSQERSTHRGIPPTPNARRRRIRACTRPTVPCRQSHRRCGRRDNRNRSDASGRRGHDVSRPRTGIRPRCSTATTTTTTTTSGPVLLVPFVVAYPPPCSASGRSRRGRPGGRPSTASPPSRLRRRPRPTLSLPRLFYYPPPPRRPRRTNVKVDRPPFRHERETAVLVAGDAPRSVTRDVRAKRGRPRPPHDLRRILDQ